MIPSKVPIPLSRFLGPGLKVVRNHVRARAEKGGEAMKGAGPGIYAENPYCEKCGKLDRALVDGYAFGDRLLEGVKFVVTLSADGAIACRNVSSSTVVVATTRPLGKKYMADLNESKWLKEAAKFAAETDTLECPKCGGDIDGFGVIGAPVRVEV